MSPLTLCSANSLPSGTHSVQSMHSSGSIAGKFAPSWKQSIGHTSTQSVYLHLSVTTWVMITSSAVVLVRKLGASGNPEFAIARGRAGRRAGQRRGAHSLNCISARGVRQLGLTGADINVTPAYKGPRSAEVCRSESVRPHRWKPIRLPRPWDSPGKNTGVGCHFLLQCMKVKSESEVAQSRSEEHTS